MHQDSSVEYWVALKKTLPISKNLDDLASLPVRRLREIVITAYKEGREAGERSERQFPRSRDLTGS